MYNFFPLFRGSVLGKPHLTRRPWVHLLLTLCASPGAVAAWTLIVLGIAIHFQMSFVDSSAERTSLLYSPLSLVLTGALSDLCISRRICCRCHSCAFPCCVSPFFAVFAIPSNHNAKSRIAGRCFHAGTRLGHKPHYTQ